MLTAVSSENTIQNILNIYRCFSMLWLVTFNDVFVAFLPLLPTIQIKKMLNTSQPKVIGEQSCRHIRSYFEEISNQY